MKWQKAYTLIEILVALTIIGLLFGIGYVNFRDFSRRQAIAGAGKLLQGDLRLAQQLALSGQKPVDPACNDPNTLDGYRFGVVSSTQYRLRADCSGGAAAVLKLVTLPDGITMSLPSPNPIIFKVLGAGTNIPSGTNATIVLTQVGTANTFTVTIGSGGEIQ